LDVPTVDEGDGRIAEREADGGSGEVEAEAGAGVPEEEVPTVALCVGAFFVDGEAAIGEAEARAGYAQHWVTESKLDWM